MSGSRSPGFWLLDSRFTALVGGMLLPKGTQERRAPNGSEQYIDA